MITNLRLNVKSVELSLDILTSSHCASLPERDNLVLLSWLESWAFSTWEGERGEGRREREGGKEGKVEEGG